MKNEIELKRLVEFVCDMKMEAMHTFGLMQNIMESHIESVEIKNKSKVSQEKYDDTIATFKYKLKDQSEKVSKMLDDLCVKFNIPDEEKAHFKYEVNMVLAEQRKYDKIADSEVAYETMYEPKKSRKKGSGNDGKE